MLKNKNKSSDEMIRSMRRSAICIFISVEEDVASDISRCLCQAADRMEMLEAELERLRSEFERRGIPYE